MGLVAALFVAMLAPAAVMSAPKAPPPAISEAQRKQGMADAPALAQTVGLVCQVSDARFIGKQEDKKAKTSTSYYEIACGGGLGFIVQAPLGGTPTAFSCIEADTPQPDGKPSSLPCILPTNLDPKAALVPMLAKAGVQCVPVNTRGVGQSKTSTYLEVACQDGNGYIMIASAPLDPAKEIQAQNCLAFDDGGGNIKCTLSDKAARLAVVDRFAAAANTGCVVKDRRYVGASKEGANFFESACQDGKGYIYKIDAKGALAQTWDCAKAQGVLGGCELTNAREAETAQASLYSKLARNSGSNCDVDKYALFPMRGSDEVVELVCKDGGGGVGFFPATGKGQVLDGAKALVDGYKCGLNKAGAGNDVFTADLRKFDQKTCVVSNARLAAKTTKGTILVEVACADGYKGYMIEYNTTPTVSAVGATGCAFAGGCKLPGNT
ncbi:MAG: hypothetical protein ABI655_02305 [Phenylobacterium sp.]